MLVGFISTIPDEIEDAAMIDGASRLGVIWHVVLPLIRPGLASVTIFMLLSSWNEFALAVTLTARHSRTLPVTMYTFVTNQNIAWGELSAAGVLSATPIVIAGLLVQKHLVMGLGVWLRQMRAGVEKGGNHKPNWIQSRKSDVN